MEVKKKRIYGRVTDVFYYVWDSLRPENQNTIFVSSRGQSRASVVKGVVYSYWKPQGAIFGRDGHRFGVVDYNRYSPTTASDTSTIAYAIHHHREEIGGEEHIIETVPILTGNLNELLELATGKSSLFRVTPEEIATNSEYLDTIKDFELLWVEKDDYFAKNYALRIRNYSEDGDLFILSYTDPNAPQRARNSFYWLKLTGKEIEEATGMDAETFALNVQSSGLQWALEQLLEPEEVKEARRKGIPFIRQGDLYFIETSENTRSLKNRAIIYWKRIKKSKDWRGRTIYDYQPIIDPDEEGKEPKTFTPQKPDDYQFRVALQEALDLLGNHYPREVIITNDFTIYARGNVRHSNGDHKAVNLGEKWHKVVRERLHDKVEKYIEGIGGSPVAD